MKLPVHINFGTLRIAVVRSIFMFSLMTFVMVAVDFIRTHGWQWWYLAIPFIISGWYLFDMCVVWKQEIDATYKYSSDIRIIKGQLEEIIKRLHKEADVQD